MVIFLVDVEGGGGEGGVKGQTTLPVSFQCLFYHHVL